MKQMLRVACDFAMLVGLLPTVANGSVGPGIPLETWHRPPYRAEVQQAIQPKIKLVSQIGAHRTLEGCVNFGPIYRREKMAALVSVTEADVTGYWVSKVYQGKRYTELTIRLKAALDELWSFQIYETNGACERYSITVIRE